MQPCTWGATSSMHSKDLGSCNAELQDAAAVGQGSSGRQQAPPPPTPEPVSTGAPQMIVDPETGNLVLDRASLTVQAQPREEYVRREEGLHDLVNSQTYLKRGATNKWTPEETDEFWAVSYSTRYTSGLSGLINQPMTAVLIV